MQIRNVGLSKSDLLDMANFFKSEAGLLKDGNGAPPRETIDDAPNADYTRYVQLSRVSQAAFMLYEQTVFYDAENTTDTNPAALLSGVVGTY